MNRRKNSTERPVFPRAALSAVTLGVLLGGMPASAQTAGAVEALFPASAATAPGPGAPAAAPEESGTAESFRQRQKRLDHVEARLGISTRPPSVAFNVERRLADLEKRLAQIEQQLARMQTWDARLRRLEMKQP